jgi:tRNA (guanine10-N2)-methyltransferase
MEYLIRFVQQHESFRKPELETVASIAEVALEILDYRQDVRQP